MADPLPEDLPSPYRVVAVHNSDATTWIGAGNPHADEYVNQAEVNGMVERGIKDLTGKDNYIEGWRELIPYSAGEVVAIKLNFNNVSDWSDDPALNPNAVLVNALIDGLTAIGVPGDKIWLVDPSRRINDLFRRRINNQEVLFFTGYDPESKARVIQTSYVDLDSPDVSLSDFGLDGINAIRPAQVFVDADHLIDMPQLKGHEDASITLGIKNHYGSAIIGTQGRSYWHKYFWAANPAYRTEPNPLIEIYRNPHIRNKTRLIIGDGLYGHPTARGPAETNPGMLFKSFDNNPPETIFFGVDPVAVDSVMFDYLQRECWLKGYSARNDDILFDAAAAGLGVFEHWNSDDERQYTVIEYIEVDL